MKILGLEIKKIKKKDMPKKVDNGNFTLDTEITSKGKDYLFGLIKGGPFSRKKNQEYLHYDSIRIANNRIYWMWKGDAIASQLIIGDYTGDAFTIKGILGKQKVSM